MLADSLLATDETSAGSGATTGVVIVLVLATLLSAGWTGCATYVLVEHVCRKRLRKRAFGADLKRPGGSYRMSGALLVCMDPTTTTTKGAEAETCVDKPNETSSLVEDQL